jgi:hypothetical protein
MTLGSLYSGAIDAFAYAAAGDSIQAQIPVILLGFIKQIHELINTHL